MKSLRQSAVRFFSLALIVPASFAERQAAAATRTFTLDSTRSSLKITGYVTSTSVTLSAQTGTSDTASYFGSVVTSIDPTGITFPGGSSITANNFSGGSLAPDATANYGVVAKALGGLVTAANATVINLEFNATSGDLPIATNGTFTANSGLTATAIVGSFDYKETPIAGGSSGNDNVAGDSAVNQSTSTGSLTLSGQTQTLTIPVNATISFSTTGGSTTDSAVTFTGQFVATTTLVTPTTAYWTGNVDTNWNTINSAATATNWATDATGATDTQDYPGAATDVFFNASAANGSHLSTTLAANFSIKGLTFSSTATSPVTIGGANTLTLGIDGITVQSGAAAPTINSPVTLGSAQNWTINGSNPLTVNGALSTAGFTLTKMGTGTLNVGGVPNLAANTALNVNAGTLLLQATAAPTIGSGVTAAVSSGATLQLAGSVSDLSNGAARVNITNSSTAAGTGIIVSGTNQQVGTIDGTGNLTINAGGSLTANHVRQSALILGGSAGQPAILTIAVSNASGVSLTTDAAASGFELAPALRQTGSFGTGLDNAADLLAAAGSTVSPAAGDLTTGGSFSSAGQAVPEPSTLLLVLFGGLVGLAAMLRRRRAI